MKLIEDQSPPAATTRQFVAWETAYKVEMPSDLLGLLQMADGPLYEWPDKKFRIKIFGCQQSCGIADSYHVSERCEGGIPLAQGDGYLAIYKKENDQISGIYVVPENDVTWSSAVYACMSLNDLLAAGKSLGEWYKR
ncbi:hypothetical protein [Microbulbifer hydrolyticus]|uniref:SMI1/KNR4 family protein n=1 Tax=Microbulbifer hydrolyticus TaxID=48074 RepID=A0A6P1T9R0_9GAMM|nr:hypothetical protein [Microbulbifer hydrolyticus]MBB5213332.1 hypothetical protein [Microbulbifer hydrolyticus]QHQ38485.1 hypothetical protein GTQ55_05415 [Microbulbifer hydrolyticus]